MDLKPVTNTINFKKLVYYNFDLLREQNPSLNKFIYEVSLSNNLFIIGGFLRNIANDEQPRDIDLIINLKKSTLDSLIKDCFKEYKENRLGGYKVILKHIVTDIWSIEDNWAFKMRVVKNFEKDHLNKIARGTFFNYDSLVFDLHTSQYNFKEYNSCAASKVLDILKKNSKYKRLNPTKEANILRALYLKVRYGLNFSTQLTSYIGEYTFYAKQTFGNASVKIIETLNKYEKYHNFLTSEGIVELLNRIEYDLVRVRSKDSSDLNNDLFSSLTKTD